MLSYQERSVPGVVRGAAVPAQHPGQLFDCCLGDRSAVRPNEPHPDPVDASELFPNVRIPFDRPGALCTLGTAPYPAGILHKQEQRIRGHHGPELGDLIHGLDDPHGIDAHEAANERVENGDPGTGTGIDAYYVACGAQYRQVMYRSNTSITTLSRPFTWNMPRLYVAGTRLSYEGHKPCGSTKRSSSVSWSMVGSSSATK